MGAAQDHLSGLLTRANGDLLASRQLQRLGAIDPAEQAAAIAHFESGRRHIKFVFMVKLAFWQQFPWLLFGLAHHDKLQAQACARRAILYTEHVHSWEDEHPVARQLFFSAGLSQQLEDFACAEDPLLSQFPELEAFAAQFRFSMTSERWIEGRHAQVGKAIAVASHSGAVHVAFHSILPSLRAWFSCHPDTFSDLSAHCAKTKHARACIHECGLVSHPTVIGLLRGAGGKLREMHRRARKLLIQVLYHVDPASLFRDMSPQAAPPDEPPLPPRPMPRRGGSGAPPSAGARPAAPPPAGAVGGHDFMASAGAGHGAASAASSPAAGASSGSRAPAHRISTATSSTEPIRAITSAALAQPEIMAARRPDDAYELCLKACMFDFLRARMSDWEEEFGTFKEEVLSLAAHDSKIGGAGNVTFPGQLLSSALGVDVAQAQGVDRWGGAGADFDFKPEGCLQELGQKSAAGDSMIGDSFFFSIVHAGPSKLKVVPCSKKIKGADKICVQLLTPLKSLKLAETDTDTEKKGTNVAKVKLDADLGSDNGMFLLSPSLLSSSGLLSMCCWKRAKSIELDVGVAVPDEFQLPMQAVLKALNAGPLQLPSGDGAPTSASTCLELLASSGIAQCCQEEEDDDQTWKLTKYGQSASNVAVDLSQPQHVFVPRPGINDSDKETFELACALAADGWEHRVHCKGHKHPKPYVLGADKIFWLQPKQQRFSLHYFKALLLAAKHGQEIPHFRSRASYATILDGKPAPSKSKRCMAQNLKLMHCILNIFK